jgi:hypothetical protein
MRSLTVVALLGLLLLNTFGFYFAFVAKQTEVKSKVAIAMQSKSHSSIIALSQQQYARLVWTTAGKEFLFNGKLYDVASVNTDGNMIQLRVEDDSMETELIADFVSLFASKQNKEQNNSPIKFLLAQFLGEFTGTEIFRLNALCFTSVSIHETEISFSSFVALRQTPPPDSLS